MGRATLKKAAVGVAGRRSGGSSGGQIAWFHVLLALAFLIVFGASFGVVFEYAPLAVQSLEADLDGPAHCTISVVVAVANVTCEGGAATGDAVPCYVVRGTATLAAAAQKDAGNCSDGSVAVNAVNASATKTTLAGIVELRTAPTTAEPAVADDLIVHAYYTDYYTNRHCTFTMCDDGGAGGGRLTAGRRSKLRLLKMAAAIESSSQLPPSRRPAAATEWAALATDSVGASLPASAWASAALHHLPTTEKVPSNNWTMRCWLDKRKPGRAFLGLNEVAAVAATPETESSESALPLDRAEAYAVLAAPPTVIMVCMAALVVCVATGRLRADEVHQPVVTPNHILIDGRWYLRSPRPPIPTADVGRSPDGGVGGMHQHDSGKWQALKQALGH